VPSPLTAILTPNNFSLPADTSNTFPFHTSSSPAATTVRHLPIQFITIPEMHHNNVS